MYIRTIDAQNYTNYKIIFADDFSHEVELYKFMIIVREKYPRFHNRMTIISLKKKIGDLAKKDIMIRKYCSEKDIVLEINAEMMLVGRQIFKLFNHFYKNKNTWYAELAHLE